jgi:hypothetical protein
MFQNLISCYGSRLHDFWYEAQKRQKTNARDNGLQGWNDVTILRDFKPLYILEDIWPQYLVHMMSEQFT